MQEVYFFIHQIVSSGKKMYTKYTPDESLRHQKNMLNTIFYRFFNTHRINHQNKIYTEVNRIIKLLPRY